MIKKKTIFVSLYRSFAIRYILETGLLDELARDHKIIIFMKNENIHYYKNFFKTHKKDFFVEDIFYSQASLLKKNILADFFILLRRFISGSKSGYINKNVNDLWNIKFDQEIRNKHFYYPIKFFCFFLNKFKYLRLFLRFFESFTQNNKIYDNYFLKYKPDLLILSSSGYDIDQYFIKASNKYNCKSVGIVYSWDNPTTKGYSALVPSYIICWNDILKKEISIFHDIKKQNIFPTGVIHWDNYFKDEKSHTSIKEDFCNRLNLKNKKIITFFSSAPNEFKNSFNVISDLISLKNENKIEFDVQFLIRLHPLFLEDNFQKNFLNFNLNKKINELSKNQDIQFINPHIIKTGGESSFDTKYPIGDINIIKEILISSDVFICEYSTTMIEACIFDKPIINVGYGEYRNTGKHIKNFEKHHHIQRAKAADFFRIAYDKSKLCTHINNYLRNPKLDFENRENFLNKELNHIKGNSKEFTVKILNSLLS